jgi:hypothetical protein
MPPGRPPAAAGTEAVDRVADPAKAPAAPAAEPYAALTGQPAVEPAPGLPRGSYPSPWLTDGPGCCGPLGRNGQIGYEIYWYTGPTIPMGEGRFGRQLHTGWMIGGGGRSLFFNTTHDAAWVLDLGLSYQYTHGSPGHFQALEIEQAPDIFGEPQPNVIAETAIRGLHRTNFNFGIGRDWWYWGPGTTGLAQGWNVRCGGLVGGRWGTAHVDLVPQDIERFGDYQRRQGVTHGVFLAAHGTVEVPLGSWILFGGLRTEWGYEWMNLVPPLNGNLHSVNILLEVGGRF